MAFYVSVIRNMDRGPSGGFALALGPFNTLGAACAQVDAVRRYCLDRSPDGRAHWYAYGTCRKADGRPPGILNDALDYPGPGGLP